MRPSVKEEKTTLLIRYPRRRGFILEAHKLQQQITAVFNLSAVVEEHAETSFALILDEATIFSEDISASAGIDHSVILEVVGAYLKPGAKISAAASENTDEDDNDPDHRRWLNSVCSGE